jgi:hypothetical protein
MKMRILRNPKKEAEYLKKSQAFREEYKDFIEMERNIIKNLTSEELSQMREKMEEEICELNAMKKRKHIEIIMAVFLVCICVVDFWSFLFYIGLAALVLTLVSLKRTLKKIFLLNYSILIFEEEFEIYYND